MKTQIRQTLSPCGTEQPEGLHHNLVSLQRQVPRTNNCLDLIYVRQQLLSGSQTRITIWTEQAGRLTSIGGGYVHTRVPRGRDRVGANEPTMDTEAREREGVGGGRDSHD